jgi:superfamily I DNA/RNA helicase
MFEYRACKEKGLPLGSRTVESAIRRVINHRTKGGGVFWKRESAEEMILLRSLVLTGRLQIALERVSQNLDYLNAQNDLEALRPAEKRVQYFCVAPYSPKLSPTIQPGQSLRAC